MSKNKFDKMAPVVFTNDLFGTVRILKTDDGEIWFVAKDVCDALGFSETAAATRHLDSDEKMPVKLTGISTTNPVVTIINESGLYSLVLRSRKPEAKKFKKWVTGEVLPSIRKHGAYVNKQMADPSWLREMADVIEQKNLEIAEKNKALAEARPKVICTENLTNDMQRFKPMLLAGMLKVSWGVFR
jgi:prophage antirepressor-like protein